ncbi:hypothetical protein DFR59_11755 [Falsibacillus pallidus]|uniref:Calcineurin-like phosphoesterase domain-containing protein n=2 Tax=Falsibacillus pallidus TaxID=493781 RepID=A0A370G427_9BACI|nr:metallophosphoesterase [Falsibacillus pallidus]RDI38512.1 hypothetical protein DFR59_11755 [Falsibacillus pallidus]
MNSRMIGMFLLMLIAVVGLNFYIGWHLLIFMKELGGGVHAAVYWPIFALVSFGYLFGRVPGPKWLLPLFRFFKVIGSYYFAVMEFGIILLIGADIVYGILRPAGHLPGDYVLYAGWTVLILLACLMLWGTRNAWSTVIRDYPVEIRKGTGRTNTALRIAAASDIHLGNIVGNRHLKRMVERINDLKPDLILLPGDVIDDSIEPFLRNKMSETLKQLKAKYGVYAVLGNHEYYGGHIEQYVDEMKNIGIKVLRDEVVEVETEEGSVVIAGRKDKTAESMDPVGRKPVAELLSGVDPSRFIIMMDHQPYGFAAAADAGVDLLLCGHTHRGQFAPNHWLTGRLFELDWGYMKKNEMHVAVSSGYGTWGPPIRIASRSEIMKIDVGFLK